MDFLLSRQYLLIVNPGINLVHFITSTFSLSSEFLKITRFRSPIEASRVLSAIL
jgi:hypothetical protein